MPGSCYSCAATFSVFKKEHGCKHCGYCFCKDCLPKKVQIPKLKNEVHKVCAKCYNILTGNVKPEPNKQEYSPPKALQKRLDVLEEKGEGYGSGPRLTHSNPSTSRGISHGKKQPASMGKEDIAIAERLEKLKQSRKQDQPPVPSQREMEERLAKLKKDENAVAPPSETEMAERLARLRGQNPETVHTHYVAPRDHRAQQTQVDDLLQEICDEVEIDSHAFPTDQSSSQTVSGDIENNLNTSDKYDSKVFHKNIPTVGADFSSQSGEEISFQDMNRLMQEAAAELSLDAEQAIAGLKKDKDLWNRLQQLKKGKKPESTEVNTESGEGSMAAQNMASDEEEENDEEAAKRIIKQLMEESRLEESETMGENVRQRVENSPAPPTEQNSRPNIQDEPEEELWCYLCNDDADFRCQDCDDDLYCSGCFKKAHKEFGLKGHRGTPAKVPNK